MSTATKRYTVADYLALERASETKHEYFDGEIFAMAGGSEAHSLIAANCIRELGNALRSRGCRVYTSDMRIATPSGLRTYPDLSVVCESPDFEDDRRDTLLNPLAIIEVLSETTEAYDRGRKFMNYQSIESLAEYVLVAQDRWQVDQFVRQTGGQWLLTTYSDPQASLHLPTLECSLRMADVYAQVEWQEK